MAYSKGGFNQNIKREYLTMCSVYQLDWWRGFESCHAFK
jgi:hypothetical protein